MKMRSPLSRCRIGLSHYRRSLPWVPSAQALAGALDIYAEGKRHDDVGRMLFGLSILRHGTVQQLETALAGRSDVTLGDDAFST